MINDQTAEYNATRQPCISRFGMSTLYENRSGRPYLMANRLTLSRCCLSGGAHERNRTSTSVRTHEPESCASTNSATCAKPETAGREKQHAAPVNATPIVEFSGLQTENPVTGAKRPCSLRNRHSSVAMHPTPSTLTPCKKRRLPFWC